MAQTKPRILCVDDEPNILEGLSLNLGRRYAVLVAPSGVAALELLEKNRDLAVIVSDMRMPGMDGAAFLSRARVVLPDAVRVLLTGQSDMDSAIAAINEGQIFRFLTKPCLPPMLFSTIEAAVRQYQLVTAERVLLQQTLHGSIQALTDVLALANPALFGRALRVKLHVSELAMKFEIQDRWQVEVAAMLSQLGCVALPVETLQRLHLGQRLSDDEAKMVARVPILTEQLLANIPRLEGVRAILAAFAKSSFGSDTSRPDGPPHVERAASMLRVAADFDLLDAQGVAPALAMDMLRSKHGCYDGAVLDAFEAVRGIKRGVETIHEVHLSGLKVGMVLAEDVSSETGTLLAARGYEVTPGFLERVHNLRERQPRVVRVVVSRPNAVASAVTSEPAGAIRT